MSGTKIGAAKAAAKILARDPDHFKRIGSKGGKAPSDKPKGFAANPELARIAGARGGKISRKNKEN